MNRHAIRQEAIEKYGDEPADAWERINHTLLVFADEPDDKFVVMATRNVYDEGVSTGLTWGDLRSLRARVEAS